MLRRQLSFLGIDSTSNFSLVDSDSERLLSECSISIKEGRKRRQLNLKHLQKFPYVLSQQSSFTITKFWHVKVVYSFQDHLKMGTRLADFS